MTTTSGQAGLRVGELARRTGMTVRALHHYEAIGVLRPSRRTQSGHRLYMPEDVARLQQVLSLRQLGFALGEIRDCVDRPGFSARQVLQMHIERVREQIESGRRLQARLEGIAARLDAAGEVFVADLLSTVQEMIAMERHYTPEQIDQFRQAAEAVGAEEMEAVQQAWVTLLREVRAARDLDPGGARAQELGRRWEELTARTMQGYAAFPELKGAIAKNYEVGSFEGFEGAPQAADFAFIERVKGARDTA
jgi:MerR family transcriptional regulator, thiopeptide resistance regulator